MNPIDFIQLGIAGVAIVILYLVVKDSSKSQERRDSKFIEFIGIQESNFKNTIDNHMSKNSDASRQLADTIKELLDWLKYSNGKR